MDSRYQIGRFGHEGVFCCHFLYVNLWIDPYLQYLIVNWNANIITMAIKTAVSMGDYYKIGLIKTHLEINVMWWL